MATQFKNNDHLPEGTQVMSPGSFEVPTVDECISLKAHVDRGVGRGTTIEKIIVLLLSSNLSHQDQNHISGRKRAFPFSETSNKVSDPCPIHERRKDNLPAKKSEYPLHAYAYWPVRVIRDAIFGRVWYGIELERRDDATSEGSVSLWKATGKEVAIKEMNIAMIDKRIKVDNTENPYQEISAMQRMKREYLSSTCTANTRGLSSREALRDRVRDAVRTTNVMMPLDVLKDDNHIFCVMPYCDGCEMFSLLVDRRNSRAFRENKARFLFKQILDGIKFLQKAGICHLDISLENLMITKDDRVIIIDFGGSIQIPYVGRKRCLIKPFRSPRGKRYYMSNEIVLRDRPFDGHAVDVWSLGPILHMLVFGRQPWELAHEMDDHFKCFSGGLFKEYTAQWDHGLSPDLIDLLHHMFLLNPEDRLSLEQIQNHPWVKFHQPSCINHMSP